jgi:hypothetical protein
MTTCVSAMIRSSTPSSSRAGKTDLQQRPRITTTQGLNVKRRQTGECAVQHSGGKRERDLLRQETARDKGPGSARTPIEPLRVINDTYERLLLGGLGEQAEDRKSDQKRVRRGPGTQSERDAERVVLGLREALEKLDERGTELLNGRKWELHLRLDPGGPGDPKSSRSLDRVLERGGLANAGVATHDQHAPVSAAHIVKQLVEHLELVLPAEQPPSRRDQRWRRSVHSA